MTAIKLTMEQFKEISDKKERKGKSPKDKKQKKKDKKRKLDDHAEDDQELSQKNEKTAETPAVDNDDEASTEQKPVKEKKKSSKEARAARRLERENLLENLPKADENGIAYTKQQLRRMRKRVARGLDPIETPHERDARIKQDSALRREEENELADMVHTKEGNDEDDQESEAEADDAGEGEETEEAKQAVFDKAAALAPPPALDKDGNPKKKAKRSKEVPADYVCQACKNKDGGSAHWIYDCPSKVTVRGTNSKSKTVRGINNPDDRKVFVSGLPFEAKVKTVMDLFADCGKIAQCKLIKFEDTGRCKGTGIITFETDAAAKMALKMNGNVIDNDAPVSPKKKKGEDAPPKRKELKLKVTKVLNRAFTKRK